MDANNQNSNIDNNFKPNIIAFCCHYCAYAAADLAGSMRLSYPTNIKIIRTPCTGRLEVEYYLKAFEKGTDGILVAGCLEGGCHFIEGNIIAKKRVNYISNLLKETGFEEKRLKMVNISAAMANQFVEEVNNMVNEITILGPNPLNKKLEK